MAWYYWQFIGRRFAAVCNLQIIYFTFEIAFRRELTTRYQQSENCTIFRVQLYTSFFAIGKLSRKVWKEECWMRWKEKIVEKSISIWSKVINSVMIQCFVLIFRSWHWLILPYINTHFVCYPSIVPNECILHMFYKFSSAGFFVFVLILYSCLVFAFVWIVGLRFPVREMIYASSKNICAPHLYSRGSACVCICICSCMCAR